MAGVGELNSAQIIKIIHSKNERQKEINKRRSKQREASRLRRQNENPRQLDEAAVRNWRFLVENLTSAGLALNFDSKTEVTPRTKLAVAKHHMDQVLERMKLFNITRLGRFNIRSEIGSVINSVNGLDEGIKNNELSSRQVNVVLSDIGNKINTVSIEIAVRVDKAILDSAQVKYEKKQEPPEPKNHASFNNLADAMKTVLAQSKIKQTINQSESVIPEEREVFEIRDQRNMQRLINEYTPALGAIKTEISRTKLGKKDRPFIFIKGPIFLETNKIGQITENNLKNADINHTIVSYPGIRFGGSPGGRKEFIGHSYIFADQFLVAIARNTTRTMQSRRTKKIRFEKTPVNVDLLRADLPEMLKAKTGRDFIDVLKESNPAKPKYIVSSKIPGVVFVWLMPQYTYQRIGSFTVTAAGLPF